MKLILLGFILGFFGGSGYKIRIMFGKKKFSLMIITEGLLYRYLMSKKERKRENE